MLLTPSFTFAALKAAAKRLKSPSSTIEQFGRDADAVRLKQEFGVKKMSTLLRNRDGASESRSLVETCRPGAQNPYSWTKFMCEQILRICRSRSDWSIERCAILNPIGAHASGLIGEDPAHPQQSQALSVQGLPRAALKAQRILRRLSDKGRHGVRDYIH
jgi:UDP-glucose 4-epimerase